MIMTGTDHHIAGLGNLIEWTNISGQNDPMEICRLLCREECQAMKAI
jgi:hypothetical protein